jgi:hypothetical protein
MDITMVAASDLLDEFHSWGTLSWHHTNQRTDVKGITYKVYMEHCTCTTEEHTFGFYQAIITVLLANFLLATNVLPLDFLK